MLAMVKERRAYIGLVVFSIALSLSVLVLSAMNDARSEKKFCQLLAVQVGYPYAKPADPIADPAAQHRYVVYTTRVALNKKLGC